MIFRWIWCKFRKRWSLNHDYKDKDDNDDDNNDDNDEDGGNDDDSSDDDDGDNDDNDYDHVNDDDSGLTLWSQIIPLKLNINDIKMMMTADWHYQVKLSLSSFSDIHPLSRWVSVNTQILSYFKVCFQIMVSYMKYFAQPKDS